MQNKPKPSSEKEKKDFPGYPIYPESEDIFNNQVVEPDLDPENTKEIKSVNEPPEASNEKDFEDDVSGDDLDIPGAELDDLQEDIGSEDEENNYYSLGGDNHENQEENNDK